jgi:hypothetical protein
MSRCLGIPADGEAVAFWPLIDHATRATARKPIVRLRPYRPF